MKAKGDSRGANLEQPRPSALPSETLRQSITLLSGKIVVLHLAEHAAKTSVLLQNLKVVNTIAARKVEQNESQTHLRIAEPVVSTGTHVTLKRVSDAESFEKIKVEKKAGVRGHAFFSFFLFVLERKDPLCIIVSPC